MKLKNIVGFLSILVVTMAFGQKPNLTGKLIDQESKEPIEYATISVLNSEDGTLVGGGLSGMDGTFAISVKPGTYDIKIQFVTFQTKEINGVAVGRNTDLGTISMSVSTTELSEVVVEGERTVMELQLDKKVYNIGKDLSNLGGSASDLLANLPSVEVDTEGNVSLRGSENVQILIDGRPSSLIGLSGTGGLQNLQGNLIEKVEIITNPSARYDAEGGAGIINIVLKKEKARGFNGSFQVQTGFPWNNGATANLNYRTGWINWFVNYGVTYRENPGQGFNDQTYFNGFTNRLYSELFPSYNDTSFFTNQDSERLRRGISNNIRFGADIYFSDNDILTLSGNYRKSDNNNRSEVDNVDLDENRVAINSSNRVDRQNEVDNNYQFAINFTKNFKRKRQKFTADAQIQDNSEVELSDFEERRTWVGNGQTTVIQQADNDNGEKRMLLQADYNHPFGQKGLVEIGFRHTDRNIFNNYQVSQLEGANFQTLDSLTNDFNFDEKVTAGYLIVSDQGEKISWQVGTRFEYTDLITILEQTDQRNTQEYFSFFPSGNLTYNLTEKNSLQLSYSRRISRPRFRSLNPFFNYSDPRNIYRGNPNLQPQFTDSYELGFLRNTRKVTVYYGLYYRFTDDVVQRIIEENNGLTERFPQNLATANSVGMELNLSLNYSKRLRSQANFNFYNSKIDGPFPAEATTFNTRIANYYRNDKLFNAQLSLWYGAPRNTAQGRRYSIASLDFGLSKDILKKNGTVALNVQDILNSRNYRGESETTTFRTESGFQWRRGPTATLSFTYRLNQKKFDRRRDRTRDGSDLDDGGFEF